MTLLHYLSSLVCFFPSSHGVVFKDIFSHKVLTGEMMSPWKLSSMMFSQRHCSMLDIRKMGPKDRNLQGQF